MITARSVDPGPLVDTTTVLFSLADTRKLPVETDVDKAYATRIALGQDAVQQLVGSREALAAKVVSRLPDVTALENLVFPTAIREGRETSAARARGTAF